MARLFSRFRPRQIRHQVFLIFSLLFLLLLSCLWAFSYRFYYQNYRQNQLSIYRLALENSYKNFANSLAVERLRMTSFLSSEETQQLVGMGDSCTGEALLSASTSLYRTLQISGYYEKAVLRIRGTDIVIEADADGSSWRTDSSVWDWSSYPTQGFWQDEEGCSFLRYDFPSSYPLASLQLYPSPQKMYRDIFSDSKLSPRTFLYSPYGTPLLGSLLDYPEENYDSLIKSELEDGSPLYTSAQDSSLSILTTDVGEDGWILVSFLPAESLTLPILKGMQTLYPYFLCFAVIILFCFLVVSRQISTPISHIAQSVSESYRSDAAGEQSSSPGNEISAIGKALQLMETRQRRYTALAEQVAPQAEKQLLLALISGTNPDTAAITESLTLIQSPFAEKERTVLFLLQWRLCAADSSDARSQDVFHTLLCSFAKEYWQETPLCILDTEECEMALLLCPQEDWPDGEFRRAAKAFLLQANLLAGSHSFLLYGDRVSCQGYGSLADAYRSIRRKVEQSRLALEDPQDDASEQERAVFYYRKKTEELLDALPSGSSGAEERLLRLLSEISSDPQENLRTRLYQAVTDCLTDTMLRLQAKENDPFFALKEQLIHAADAKEQKALLEPLAHEAQRLLHDLTQKEQYLHVQNAKKYIRQEYRNSLLTLEDVSSRLGISASYLSSLFHDYSEEGFIDYLNHYRVEQARKLLEQGSEPIAEIGEKVGFSSSQNFSRVFKKYCGITPGQYRKQAKSKGTEAKER